MKKTNLKKYIKLAVTLLMTSAIMMLAGCDDEDLYDEEYTSTDEEVSSSQFAAPKPSSAIDAGTILIMRRSARISANIFFIIDASL